jgi:radical SAM superfamily enzyme YgiQ (UPF0313 family)
MLLRYNEPLFRPPSEGRSLIFQVTLGCSWNSCSFCEMYTSKSFKVRSFEEVATEIRAAGFTFPQTEKIFLADGDALVLSNKKLLPILSLLREKFPRLKRVSSYALPKNLLVKSVDELRELREAGLTMLYYGVETGDPLLLQKIQKGATREEMIEGMAKAHEAGMEISTTNLLGVGGKKYSEQHARHTAQLLSETQPKYISFLTLMFPLGEERFRADFGGDFEELNPFELMAELKAIVQNLNVRDSEFRSNHASNYLPLKAHLPDEKETLLATIDAALQHPASYLRPETLRGL